MNDTETSTISKSKQKLNSEVPGILSSDQIVQIIFANTDSIFEKRLQSLAFLAEVEWLMNHNSGKQLSKASYTRTPKGIYSDTIRDSISNIDNHYVRVAYDNGFRTKKWYVEDVKMPESESEVSDQAYECITKIQNKSIDISDNHLRKLCIQFNITDISTGERINLEKLL